MEFLTDLCDSSNIIISGKTFMLAYMLFKFIQLLESVFQFVIDLLFNHH